MTDTFNHYFVGVQGDDVIIMRTPTIGTQGIRMSRDGALNLAAWIVAVADPGDEDFTDLLAAVRAT